MGSLVLFGAATSMAFCLVLGLEAPGRAAPMVKPWDKFDSLGDTEVSDASGAAEDARTVLHGEPT
jgi:hypothetical protein